jgi:hypothetical protein
VNRLLALRRGRERFGVALILACITLVVVAFGTMVLARTVENPEAVTASVTVCDLRASDAAQVAFTVANGDRVLHGYRVTVSVVDGSDILGTSVALVNHVAAGTAADARALVALTAKRPKAWCSVRAETFTGDIGHYSGTH